MKAAVYYETGGPEVLRCEEVPDPVCHPRGVVIDVAAIGIEGGDAGNRARGAMPARPHVVGYNCAGVVREVGAEVSDRRVGDRVTALMVHGSHAERAGVAAAQTWLVPDGLSLEHAACVPVAWGTAHDCLFEFGRLAAGESVLVQAGGSGVGLACVQLAKRAGATVFATAGSPEKLERLRGFGVDHGIAYRDVDFVEAVREKTQGRGVDLVVDPVGGDTLQRSLLCLAYRGRAITVGNSSRGDLRVDPAPLSAGNRTLTGVFLGAEAFFQAARVRAMLDSILSDLAKGELRVVVDRTFPLAEAAAAHAYVEGRAAFGRVVLVPRDARGDLKPRRRRVVVPLSRPGPLATVGQRGSRVGAIRIPFNRPTFVGREQRYLEEAIGSGHWSGDGSFTRRCHALLEQSLGVPRALLTTSCTHALEMAALLLDISPGDEVIVPCFTFVSTVNAFVLRGARPVFADVRPDTLNLDERSVEGLATPRTRAIVPVHYAGVACEMDALLELAARRSIAVVEDNAHGLFGRYRGRYLGSFGALATQSFHETKNFSCGEGGALLVNDPSLADRAEILREKGTNRSRFFRGQVDKYSWVDLGSSYLPSDLLAAVLLAQLEAREAVQETRRRLWQRYDDVLRPWALERGIQPPFVPEHCEQAYHMYYLLLPSLERRQALIARLRARGILAVFHYLPLNLSEMGRRLGGRPGQCPVTEDVSDRLLRLPFFNGLTDPEQDEILGTILAEYERG